MPRRPPAALRASKDVVVEIPVALSLTDGEEITSYSAQVGRRVEVYHTMRRAVDVLCLSLCGIAKICFRRPSSLWAVSANVGVEFSRLWRFERVSTRSEPDSFSDVRR